MRFDETWEMKKGSRGFVKGKANNLSLSEELFLLVNNTRGYHECQKYLPV